MSLHCRLLRLLRRRHRRTHRGVTTGKRRARSSQNLPWAGLRRSRPRGYSRRRTVRCKRRTRRGGSRMLRSRLSRRSRLRRRGLRRWTGSGRRGRSRRRTRRRMSYRRNRNCRHADRRSGLAIRRQRRAQRRGTGGRRWGCGGSRSRLLRRCCRFDAGRGRRHDCRRSLGLLRFDGNIGPRYRGLERTLVILVLAAILNVSSERRAIKAEVLPQLDRHILVD